MKPVSRHQCMIYEGAPSRTLSALAEVARKKLQENYCCLYLNSPVMVAGMRCALAATGVDVAKHVGDGSLLISSAQGHLVEGRFHVERMMQSLEKALNQSLANGYVGLWASGDMSWEFGHERDFALVLEYEWRLEQFFREHAEICGICQYHRETLPDVVLRQGLASHQSIFVNETLSRINPHYVLRKSVPDLATVRLPELDLALVGLSQTAG